MLSGKVSGTRAFIKLGRSYAVVRYNNESPQLNPHPHRQQKKNLCAPLLLLSCSLPALYFLQTVAKMIVWKKTFWWVFSCLFPPVISPGVLLFCLGFCSNLAFCKYCSFSDSFIFERGAGGMSCCTLKGQSWEYSGQGDESFMSPKPLEYGAQKFDPQILPDCATISFISTFSGK